MTSLGAREARPVEAVLFDINGTIIDIETEDWGGVTIGQVSQYLSYHGIGTRPSELAELVRELLHRQIQASPERFPEFDAVALWRSTLDTLGGRPPREGRSLRISHDGSSLLLEDPDLPLVLAHLQRALSRRRLRPYPEVAEVLGALRPNFKLAIVSDAQSEYARSELDECGLTSYFDTVIVSGEVGYRKPDPRIFQAALDAIGTTADRSIFVGNDAHRDIFGAAQLGFRTIFTPTRFGTKDFPGASPDVVALRFADVLEGVRRLAGR